jgi:hypothetical protein
MSPIWLICITPIWPPHIHILNLNCSTMRQTSVTPPYCLMNHINKTSPGRFDMCPVVTWPATDEGSMYLILGHYLSTSSGQWATHRYLHYTHWLYDKYIWSWNSRVWWLWRHIYEGHNTSERCTHGASIAFKMDMCVTMHDDQFRSINMISGQLRTTAENTVDPEMLTILVCIYL